MESFAAEGGFRVSAIHTAAGETKDVRVLSTLGGECRVANPWPGRAVEVTAADGGKAIGAGGPKSHVTFPTRRGKTYLLRPR
jgi:hypothetical protein